MILELETLIKRNKNKSSQPTHTSLPANLSNVPTDDIGFGEHSDNGPCVTQHALSDVVEPSEHEMMPCTCVDLNFLLDTVPHICRKILNS